MKLRAVKKHNPKYKHSYTKPLCIVHKALDIFLILLFSAAQGP